MAKLTNPNVSHQQFDTALPGLGEGEHPSTTPAKPWQQTENQFNSRPDVMFHYRFANITDRNAPDLKTLKGDTSYGQGFHAGTLQAAQDRVNDLGLPNSGTTPVLHVGHVDRAKMAPEFSEDQGTDWNPEHHNSYYVNDSEDSGSVSSIHAIDRTGYPQNFTTWRHGVSQAMSRGENVPSHVRAEYEAKGGHEKVNESGLVDPNFQHVGHLRKSDHAPSIPGLTKGVKRNYGNEVRGGTETAYIPQDDISKAYAGVAQGNRTFHPSDPEMRAEYNPHTGTMYREKQGDEYASFEPNREVGGARLPRDPRRYYAPGTQVDLRT